ncbi:hypothetical protein [Streptomyces sp. NPDC052225]
MNETPWAAPGGGPDSPPWLGAAFAVVVVILAVAMVIGWIRSKR